jgi:formylglycine-generating enzyme required for sulfatase activity
MSSLAELPEVVGFSSYSREDDEDFRGSLSALRDAIARELRAQLGRTKRNFRLWQDQDAIAPGKDWESAIKTAVGQAVFFIPIVTPRAVTSEYCKIEFDSFLARERGLGRADLVFPILYISVPALLDEAEWRGDPVLSIVAKRQYVDWRPFRREGVDTPVFGQAIERFCGKIVETLRERWLSPEERRQLEAEAKRRAEEEERLRLETEAKRQAEERERLRKEAEAKRRAEREARRREEAERRRQESDAKTRAEEEQRARQEAEAKKRAEEETAKRRREEAEAQRRLAEAGERQRQESEAKRHAEGQEAIEQERNGWELDVRPPSAPTEAKRSPEGPQHSDDIPEANRTFISQSREAARGRRRWAQALAGVLVVAMAAGAVAWWKHDLTVSQERALRAAEEQAAQERALKAEQYQAAQERALKAEQDQAAQERALKPGDSFRECKYCPEMIVVPAGRFTMGSPAGQGDDKERPQHDVTIAKPLAVAKFEVTFDEWDACAAQGDCYSLVSDWWGRGRRPAINVSWGDAQTYVKWLSRMTGKTYRLLSEAEYEYAARAGTQTTYPWGPDIKLNGKAMANCDGCGGLWYNKETAPVGSFPANAFGLYEMVGNVWEWTEDCWNEDHRGAPADGSPRSGDCSRRVIRGGSWLDYPEDLRSANRVGVTPDVRNDNLGFRVARTLIP